MSDNQEYLQAVEKAYLALMQSETDEALEFCLSAAKLEPLATLHLFVLALISMSLSDLGRGIKFLEEGHKRAPNIKEFGDALSAFHARVGNMSESMYYAKLVLVMDSDPVMAKFLPAEFSELERNLEYAGVTTYLVDASIAYHERDYRKAVDLCGKELAVHPDNVECLQLLGRAWMAMQEFEEAITSLREAVEKGSADVDNHVYLGDALMAAGRAEAAQKAYRDGIQHGPTSIEARNRLVQAMANCPDAIWETRDAEIDEISGLLDEIKLPGPVRPPAPMNNDRLTVGFLVGEGNLAGDIRFLQSLLRGYDHNRMRTVVYQQYSQPFPGTTALVSLVEDWRQTYDIDDETLDLIIRNDGIQILVDLCGLRAGHRQRVLAGRPAPVQINWLGFPYVRVPATTDSVFIDDGALATGKASKSFVSLGANMVAYGGGSVDIETGTERPAPALENGYVTFGAVLDPASLMSSAALWAKVLERVPEARLNLGGSGNVFPGTRAQVDKIFNDLGVGDRVEIGGEDGGGSAPAAFFAAIDILLDSKWISGFAMVCDALWMGIPVVSLRGDRLPARLGASVLEAAGFPEWVSSDEQGFIDTVAKLSSDRDQFSIWRQDLRQQVQDSRLCDEKAFAMDFHDCIEKIWKKAKPKPKAKSKSKPKTKAKPKPKATSKPKPKAKTKSKS